MKGWIFAIIGILTAVSVAYEGAGYQAATSSEKQEKVQNIRNKIIWGGGIFVAVWFVTYVVDKFKVVNP
jgi:hypothetical protein